MPDRREELVRKMVAEGTSDEDIRATLQAFDAQQPKTKADPFASARALAGGAPASELWQNVKDHPVEAGAMIGAGLLTGGAAGPMAQVGRAALGAAGGAGYGIAADAMRRGPSPSMEDDVATMAKAGAVAGGAMALPAAINAIPRTSRAAGNFQAVMGAARNEPIDITAPGNVALRIQELADRGGSMPMAVRKFLLRVTDPQKPAMNYEEARDFASNISRLSADEFNRLTPAVAREVSEMRVALNKAVADAAGKAGKGAQYAQAMTEYAKAMRLRNAVNEVVQGAARAVPYAGAAGAGYWLTHKITSLLGGD